MRNGQTHNRRRSSNTGLISSLLFPPSDDSEHNMTSNKKTSFPIVQHLLQRAKKHHQRRNSRRKSLKQEPAESKYLLTATEEESERIQLKNDLVKLAFECEYALPIDFNTFDQGRILDIGCGPGSWCLDIAAKFPSIEVIGIDCEDGMFPDPATLPENCSFRKHNLLETNLVKQFKTPFDYIHIRFMNLSLTHEQYTKVISDCWRLLKNGGYLELMEIDMTINNPGKTTKKKNDDLIQAAVARGFNPHLANQLSSLIPAQAIPIVENYRSMPIGVWGGRLGVLFREDMMGVMFHAQKAVCEHFGRDEKTWEEQVENELATISSEVEQHHSYSNFYYKCVQKPEA